MNPRTIIGLLISGMLAVILLVTVSLSHIIQPKPAVLSETTPKLTGTVLFVSDYTGNQEIYKMDLATLKALNLTNHEANDMNPQVTADGRFMVFYSDRDGDNEIYQMNLDDNSVSQLTHNNAGDYDPSYSPDGTQIVFKSTRDDGYGDIFVMQPDGSGQKNLTLNRDKTEEWDPTFTAAGKRIVFVSRLGENHTNDELFLMDSEGKSSQQLTNNAVPDWYPAMHPLESRFAFISSANADSLDSIYVSSIDQFSPTSQVSLPGGSDDPAWSPNGEKIIFINNQDGDYDLYSMEENGKNLTKIADTPFDELSPVYIP